MTEIKQYPELLTIFPSFCKLIRVTAYIFRFKHNIQNNKKSHIEGNDKKSHIEGNDKITGFLSTDGLKLVRIKFIKISQEIDF